MEQIFSTIKFGVKVSATMVVATMCNTMVCIESKVIDVNKSYWQPSFIKFGANLITTTLPAILTATYAKHFAQELTDNKYVSYIATLIGGCSLNYMLNKLSDAAGLCKLSSIAIINHHLYQIEQQDIGKQIIMGDNVLGSCLNTAAQTVLIDMIWNGFPSSNDKAQDLPEIECIIQDDYELGVQPQDYYDNEYVMAAG